MDEFSQNFRSGSLRTKNNLLNFGGDRQPTVGENVELVCITANRASLSELLFCSVPLYANRQHQANQQFD